MATIHAFDGFEHGPATLASGTGPDALGGTVVTVTSPVRTGTRALELSPAGAAEWAQYSLPASSFVVTHAFYARFNTLPSAVIPIVRWAPTGSTQAFIRFDGGGTNKFGTRIGGVDVFAGDAISANTWYRIVCEFDTSTGTARIRLTVDRTEIADRSSAQVSGAQPNTLIGTAGAETYTMYVDDWIISATDGDYEEICGWKSHRVESLIPNADGTHNIAASGDFDSFTGTAFSNSTTNGNTFIAHRPLQRANTADQVVRQELGTTSHYMEFLNEDLSNAADTVDGVRTYATHIESAASGASLGEARLLLSDNTVVLTTGSIDPIDSTEDPGTTVTTRDRPTIAPSGGWDGTKVDGLKWRVGFADNAPDVNFIDLMVEVLQHEVQLTGTPVTVTPTLPTGEVQAAGGGATLDGVVLTVTPSLPTGNIGGSQLLGTVLTVTPSLPVGNIGGSQLLGTVLTVTPSLPVGALSTGAAQLLGVALTVTPTLPTGAVRPSSLVGTVLTITPTLPTGAVRPSSLVGTVLTVVPTLPTGAVRVSSLRAVVLTVTPTLPVGALVAAASLQGVTLLVVPSLPQGLITGPQPPQDLYYHGGQGWAHHNAVP